MNIKQLLLNISFADFTTEIFFSKFGNILEIIKAQKKYTFLLISINIILNNESCLEVHLILKKIWKVK